MSLDLVSENRICERQTHEVALRMLNVGCGANFHSDWINLDLVALHANVVTHDLNNGLPFESESLDVVYHSHVLEHLDPGGGHALLLECFRVLKPGGILRIVVPDLERIADLYLEMHDRAWDGDEVAKTDYSWMKLELLDQLVRERSGGRMGPYMSDPEIKNSDFVRSRVGDEYSRCSEHPCWAGGKATPNDRPKIGLRMLREWLARKFVWLFLGRAGENAFREGIFRSSGEIHRWMYDRHSLREVCHRVGFSDFEVMSASQSGIPGFGSYDLDILEHEIRKPDSLFVECMKPVLNIS